ncbi:MAG: hypothetical protein PVI78_03915 [Anaerolineales bacterium]
MKFTSHALGFTWLDVIDEGVKLFAEIAAKHQDYYHSLAPSG